MKIISKQKNSRMCVICGMDNKYGLHAQFYNMEDGSVMSKFQYREEHQSYPGRVHGGLITAMLDEMGLRALWAKEGNEEEMGVTMSLDTKYRKPVPYNTELRWCKRNLVFTSIQIKKVDFTKLHTYNISSYIYN